MEAELKKAKLDDLTQAVALYPAITTSKEVGSLTTLLERVKETEEQMQGGGDAGEGGEGGISVSVSETPVPGDYKPTKHKFEVVEGGVQRGQYQGAVIKVDIAALINNTSVTFEDVEVVVGKRRFIPNERNAEKVEVLLEVTKDQYFDIEKKHGAEFVKKIGGLRKVVFWGKKSKYTYTLPLKAGQAE